MGSKKEQENLNVDEKVMDMSAASRGVWLVKVPKYISSRWEKCPENNTVGQIKITSVPGQELVKLTLSATIMSLQRKGEESIPRVHELMMSEVTGQTLGVFSQPTDVISSASASENSSTLFHSEIIKFEGKVLKKVTFCPTDNPKYMKLKKDSLVNASKPPRIVKPMDNVFKSKLNKTNKPGATKKGKKASVDESKVIEQSLFAAFEKHQYYSIKDLVKITNQPKTHLKKILKEFCDYKTTMPHQNMWELKPEYRHSNKEDKD